MTQLPRVKKDLAYILLEFNKKYGSPRIPFISVVEGNDEAYYRPRVSAQTIEDNPLEFVSAEGKTNVIKLLDIVQADPETYIESRYLFFVDRDYDAPFERARCYLTSSHSVENFYTSESAFKNLVRSAFKLYSHEQEAELDDLVALYRVWSLQLSAATLDFNSWLIWQLTEAVDADGKSPKLYLNEVSLKDIFSITFSGRNISIIPIFDIGNPQVIFPHSVSMDAVQLETIQAELRQKEFLNYFRGKYALQFFIMALQHLRAEARKPTSAIFKNSKKTSLSWSDQVLAEFSSFADTPACLVSFMKHYEFAA